MKGLIKKHIKKQTGDTIVEVMLAIVVIGGALGGAIAIANRSTKTTQANYERYQAQVLANNQAELLKQKMGKDDINRGSFGNGIPLANGIGENLNCFDGGGSKASGDYSCKKQGSNSLYTVQIQCLNDTACNSGSNYSNYRIHIEWDSLKGGKDNVELFYGV